MCDTCGQEPDRNFFTIPLDANWIKTSGFFCSIQCALYANEFVNTSMRGVEDSQMRKEWMLKNTTAKTEKLKEKRKF